MLICINKLKRKYRYTYRYMCTTFITIYTALTLDCNMACPYCYEKKNNIYMSKEVSDKIIDHIDKQIISGIKNISITWYGGEPLLAIDLIKKMSKKIISMCNEKELNYTANIVTNGLLLTEEMAKTLLEYKVTFAQVTIDGLEKTHNNRRITIDGSNSFKTIIKNIKNACNIISIAVRINTDIDNQNEIPQLITYLHSVLPNDRVKIYVAPVEDKKNDGYEGCLNFIDFANFQTNIFNSFLTKESVNKFFPSPISVACGAQCINSAVIDPNGDVFKCWEQVGLTKFKIGNIVEGDNNVINLIKFVNMEIPHECYKCKFLPLCLGGCPHARMYNNNSAACTRNAASIKTILLKYYNAWCDKKITEG